MAELRVSYSTLKRYVQRGLIRTSMYQMPGRMNKKNYWDEDILALIGKKIKKDPRHLVVSYVRMNSRSKENDARMMEQKSMIYKFCGKRGISVDKLYEEYAGGADDSHTARPVFHELLREVMSGDVDAVVVESQCRLARFTWDTYLALFKYYGCELIVINKVLDDEVYKEEQSEDIATLLQNEKLKRLPKK